MLIRIRCPNSKDPKLDAKELFGRKTSPARLATSFDWFLCQWLSCRCAGSSDQQQNLANHAAVVQSQLGELLGGSLAFLPTLDYPNDFGSIRVSIEGRGSPTIVASKPRNR